MFYYKATVSYKGNTYQGFQFQRPEDKTIQREIEHSLKTLFSSHDIQVIASSRTDASVHAIFQVLKIIAPNEMTPDKLKSSLNSKLPMDIFITDIEFCEKGFNPQITESKEYHYYFSDGQINPLLNDIIYFHHSPLDVQLMKKACESFIGEHDFQNFCTPGSRSPNTKRFIDHCSIEKTNFGLMTKNADIYVLKIRSKGFLKYMVRFMMGSLLSIGEKEYTIKELQSFLTENQTNIKKAPAHGLTLAKIEL